MKKRTRSVEMKILLKLMARECISGYLAMSIAIDHNMIDIIDIEKGENSNKDSILAIGEVDGRTNEMIKRDKVELQDSMIAAGLEIFQTRDINTEDVENLKTKKHQILPGEKRLRVEKLKKNHQADFQVLFQALYTLKAALTIE